MAAEDAEKIAALERELGAARTEVQQLREKASQFEKTSAELDDESFDEAQAFQLKKELADIREELAKHDEMKEELVDCKHELSEIRAKNEELEMQHSRKSTRTDIQRIKSEKATREEVDRLHKELRQMERNARAQTSLVEAQLKVSKDSLQRAAEKTQAMQRRLDLVDKERMDLKLENQRLGRKLEKTDSYSEKKRVQMEVESQEMEIANLKRKNTKLEKQISMSTMNLSDFGKFGGQFTTQKPKRADSRTDSQISSGTSSPIPKTLSEARVENLEREVQSLEEQNSSLETQNQALKDELFAAQQKAVQIEQFQPAPGTEGEEVLTQLPQYQNSLLPQPATNGPVQDESLFHEIQQEVSKLKKQLEDKEIELRVRVKEMKATNDELKRQVEELEMEKLRLELGEDEEGGEGELTDTEEESKEKEVTPQPADNSEVKVLRERLMSLQGELVQASQSNDEMQEKLEKHKEEAELFMQSIESELSGVEGTEEEKAREQKLMERNEELKNKLNEQQEAYNDMIRETARFKAIIADQEEEIILLKVQKQQIEQELSEIMESTRNEPVFVNGDEPCERTPSPPPKKQKEQTATLPSSERHSEHVSSPPPKKPRPSISKKPKDITPPPSPEKEVTPTPEKAKSPTPTPQKVKTPTPTPEEKPKSPTPTLESATPAEVQPAPDDKQEEVDAPLDELEKEKEPPAAVQEKSPPAPVQENEPPAPVQEKASPAPVQESEKSPVQKSAPSPVPEKEKAKSGGKKLGGILSRFQAPANDKVDSGPPPQQRKLGPSIKKRPPKEWPPKPKKK